VSLRDYQCHQLIFWNQLICFFSSHLHESKSGNEFSGETHELARCCKAMRVNKMIEIGKRYSNETTNISQHSVSTGNYQYQLADNQRSGDWVFKKHKTTGFMPYQSESCDLLANHTSRFLLLSP
jgi:hypothetical protein